jgi:methionine-rich copper-binding protein CopC
LSAYYELGNDIDLSGFGNWDPIGWDGFSSEPFTGHFDGKGHTISGLTVSVPGDAGLFGIIGSGGTVQNLVLSNVNITSYVNYGSAGALAGKLKGTGVNIRVSGGIVSGLNDAGGLVGSASGGAVIQASCANVQVTGDALLGNYTGGLVGYLQEASVNASCSTGAVSGSWWVGGLAGYVEDSEIYDSYATASVSGFYGIGGLIGGVNSSSSTLARVYAAGKVTAELDWFSGGLIGDRAEITLTSVYYDKDQTGKSDNDDYSGTPTAHEDMGKEATFAGWDFDTVWHLDDRIGSPSFLRDDNTAPVMSGANISNDTPNQVSVSFPETIEADAAALARFTVSVDGNEAQIDGAQLNGKVLLLTLEEPVLNGQTVTVTYTDGDPAVTDKAQNRMLTGTIQADNEVEPHVKIVSYAPADNATGVAVDTKLILTFNDSVEAMPGKFIYLMSEGGTVVETIEASAPNVQIADHVVTIIPAAHLLPLKGYYVLIDAGAFRHTADDVHGGIANPTTWNFMTAPDPEAKWAPAGPSGFTEGKASTPVLKAGADGTLYVLFRDEAHGGKATVMKLGTNEAQWSLVGSAGFSPGKIGIPSLLVDDDVLYAAFGVVDDDNMACIHVMKYELGSAGDWTPAGKPIEVGEFNPSWLWDQDSTPFLLMHNGAVHIAYRDGTASGKMTVKKLNAGGNWETLGKAGFSEGDIYDPSLTVLDGTLYAGFTDYVFDAGFGATVMKFNTVSGNWELVGRRGFTSGNAFDTSLVSDGSRLYVVYANGARKASAMMFDSVKGEWAAAGNAGFSAGQAYDVAAAAANGELYAAYQDAGHNDRITVMKYAGSGWVPVGTAGLTPGKAFAPSLLVHGGTPYVAYEDQSSGAKLSVMKYGGFNLAPKAVNVGIKGTLQVGQTIYGEYDYKDDENDEQGASLYRWYMADNKKGFDRKIISGATKRTLELTEDLAGKYLIFEVTPVASQGTPQGASAFSAPAGPVVFPPVPAPSNLTSTAGDSQVTLNWDAVTGADSYAIYKYEGATAPANPSAWVLVEANVTATTFTVSGLQNGTLYTFAVTATAAGRTSDYSNTTTAIPLASGRSGGSGGNGEGGSGGGGTDIITSTNGDITIPADKAGKVSLKQEIIITIPAGVAGQELRITIEELTDTSDLPLDRETLVSQVYEVLKSLSGNFKKPVQLSIKFDPAKVGDRQKVAIFYYDEDGKTWVEVGGTVDGEWITAEVDHFTKFAVLAVDLDPEGNGDMPGQPDPSFTDIAGHWAENSIIRAASQKLVSGYPDGTFKPNNPVTRAEFTVMLIRALKLDGTGDALDFTDQAKIGSWAKQAISLAVQEGIVNGYADGSFRPNAPITRSEMSLMIAKALKLPLDANAQTGFADNADIPKWAKGAVKALREIGIVNGRSADKFVPNDTATRAEAVVMLLRMLDFMEQE